MYGIPNCVPEYYREQREREEYEYEKEMERQDYYKRNKKYIDRKYAEGCAIIQFYPDECFKCPYGEEAGPKFEDDDVPTKICSNWENCKVFKKDMLEDFPSETWEMIVNSLKERMEKAKHELGD